MSVHRGQAGKNISGPNLINTSESLSTIKKTAVVLGTCTLIFTAYAGATSYINNSEEILPPMKSKDVSIEKITRRDCFDNIDCRVAVSNQEDPTQPDFSERGECDIALLGSESTEWGDTVAHFLENQPKLA